MHADCENMLALSAGRVDGAGVDDSEPDGDAVCERDRDGAGGSAGVAVSDTGVGDGVADTGVRDAVAVGERVGASDRDGVLVRVADRGVAVGERDGGDGDAVGDPVSRGVTDAAGVNERDGAAARS
jgi:hypothetical protein